jgi:hypothetical protein
MSAATVDEEKLNTALAPKDLTRSEFLGEQVVIGSRPDLCFVSKRTLCYYEEALGVELRGSFLSSYNLSS